MSPFYGKDREPEAPPTAKELAFVAVCVVLFFAAVLIMGILKEVQP